MDRLKYFSENWYEATDKFMDAVMNYSADVLWCKHPNTIFSIPYTSIGGGPNKIVINSGVHGLEGYFGSAAQTMFLDKFAPKISNKILDKYTITLIHCINGWGMQNRMREVRDNDNGALVDLNRNFGIDFSRSAELPQNAKYKLTHNLLVNTPGGRDKLQKIITFYRINKDNGVWDSIKNGQYYEPCGLFYGGNKTTDEAKMTLHIYDKIITDDTKSLISIGLHTGLGHFSRSMGQTTCELLVSHPAQHAKTQKFREILNGTIPVTYDNQAVNGPVLQGDLVDCLEQRYNNIPTYTADIEIGTGEYPTLSPILKRMDMGDARYDLMHGNKIRPETFKHLTESWYPSDNGWRNAALQHAETLFSALINYMQR
ncbi:MAG: DUF2817 domain-containing protein [Proteobacteria bacterium]|nr:DUF2817 domain-containing protein [Candidatus Enterousia scatequi]